MSMDACPMRSSGLGHWLGPWYLASRGLNQVQTQQKQQAPVCMFLCPKTSYPVVIAFVRSSWYSWCETRGSCADCLAADRNGLVPGSASTPHESGNIRIPSSLESPSYPRQRILPGQIKEIQSWSCTASRPKKSTETQKSQTKSAVIPS